MRAEGTVWLADKVSLLEKDMAILTSLNGNGVAKVGAIKLPGDAQLPHWQGQLMLLLCLATLHDELLSVQAHCRNMLLLLNWPPSFSGTDFLPYAQGQVISDQRSGTAPNRWLQLASMSPACAKLHVCSQRMLQGEDCKGCATLPVMSFSSPLTSSITILWPWYAKPMPSCRGEQHLQVVCRVSYKKNHSACSFECVAASKLQDFGAPVTSGCEFTQDMLS